MIGLTPEMFESVTESIFKCSNLYKMLRCVMNKWEKSCDDSIVKVYIKKKKKHNIYLPFILHNRVLKLVVIFRH